MNSKAGKVARQLAALGLEKASSKASSVIEKAKTSYTRGRDAAEAKARGFTTGESNSVSSEQTPGGSESSSPAAANIEGRKTRKNRLSRWCRMY